jgi:23S rRNA (uracil1939-C5)-methyltransferase
LTTSQAREVEILRLAHGGQGVGRLDGQTCFVSYALPGDVVEVSIVRRARGILWARIERIVEPSPHRTVTDCPVFGKCGGCEWLHFAYPAQAEWKRRIIADCFRRIAQIDVEVGWLENAELRLGYRTRAEFHGHSGQWGFFERESHRVCAISKCPLCHPRLNTAFQKLASLRLNASVEIVANPEREDVLVWSRSDVPELRQAFPQFNCLHDGVERARFVFDGVPILNGAFSQGSLLLNRVLRGAVSNMLGNPVSLLDLYCGSGNFSLEFAQRCEVVGVDVNSAAIEAANHSVPGTYRAAREAEFGQFIRSKPWEVIVLDPPRQGAKAILSDLAASASVSLVYISCDPASLARDASALCRGGWKLLEVIGVDMFPHTSHVEVISRFFR